MTDTLKFQIIMCCQCYQHPKAHSESQLQYHLLFQQTRKQLIHHFTRRNVLVQKINDKQKLGCFEVYQKKILIYSKTIQESFPKPADLCNIAYSLEKRNSVQIETLKSQVSAGKKDLFSYLKRKNLRLSLKQIECSIQKLIQSSISGNSGSKSKMIKMKRKHQKVCQNHQTLNQFSSNFPNNEAFLCNEKSLQGRRTIRNSGSESKILNASRIKNEDRARKSVAEKSYWFLSRQQDISLKNNSRYLQQDFSSEEDFRLLELSDDQIQQIQEKDQIKQKLQQMKINEGLNFSITERSQDKDFRKMYSFQFTKFAQFLQHQLSKVDRNSNDDNHLEGDQSSKQSCQQDNVMLYNLSNKESQSSKSIQQQKISSDKEGEGQNSQSISKVEEKEQLISQQNINAEAQDPEAQFKVNTKNTSLAINYQPEFPIDKILNQRIEKQIVQIYFDAFYINSIQDLANIVLYVHSFYPTYFPTIMHNQKYQSINIVKQPSLFRLTLFNPTQGAFQTLTIRFEISQSYIGSIPHWVVVICQGILQILNNNELSVDKVLRTLTGCPIVKISGADLRKIKRLVIEDKKGEEQGERKKVLGKVQDYRGSLKFCEIEKIQMKKNILESIVHYTSDLVDKKRETRKYEEFVLDYEQILIWFIFQSYRHNQIVVKYRKGSQQPAYNENNEDLQLRIDFEMRGEGAVFIQFTQFERFDKPNLISLWKKPIIDQNQGGQAPEPIGQLTKSGNFFFQLFLEEGLYCVEIARKFEEEEENCLHFYSKYSLEILSHSFCKQMQ